MIIREIEARSILSKSAIQDRALNAYVGCAHDCRCCYARFMKRFTGHQEPWGTFVMVAPLLPGAEELAGLLRGKVGRALIDRCNCHHADRTYREHGLGRAMTEEFFQEKGKTRRAAFERAGIPCRKLY